MADTRSIEKRCENETCDVVFETKSRRKRFHSDACRLEQWERDNRVELRRVRVRKKPSGPRKPRTNWKKKYEEAAAELEQLRAQLAERTKGKHDEKRPRRARRRPAARPGN
jgi:hypothetical protein